MNKKNIFIFLSLLAIPIDYLYAAAEPPKKQARREAQDIAERMPLVNFFHADREPAIAESSDPEKKEQQEQNNAQQKNKKPTTIRGLSLVNIISKKIGLPKQIAQLIENYQQSHLKEKVVKTNNVVFSLAISPNNDSIATTQKNNIVLYDAKTDAEIITFQGPKKITCSVAFSPDGQYIASGSNDETLHIWHAKTGECLKVLRNYNRAVNFVAFSPDGQYIASGPYNNTLLISNILTDKHLSLNTLQKHNHSVNAIAFSPDSKYIASGSEDKTIHIWDIATGLCLQTLEKHNSSVNTIAFSPDGQYIASGSNDKTIRIWYVETGECLMTFLLGHMGVVISIAFSPDGQYIASVAYDKTIRIWNFTTGECFKILHGHNKVITHRRCRWLTRL